MNDKFVYQEEGELYWIECQCEECIYYNDGKFSEHCPTDKLEEIQNNNCSCNNRKFFSNLD